MTTVCVILLFHLNISMLLAIIQYNIHSKNHVADNIDDEIHTTPNDLYQDDKGICKLHFHLSISMLLAIIQDDNYSKNLVDNTDDEIQTVPNDLSPDEKGICKTCFSFKCLCVMSNYTK